jgi:hypothetical protein
MLGEEQTASSSNKEKPDKRGLRGLRKRSIDSLL